MKKYLFALLMIMSCVSLFGQIKEFKARLVTKGTQYPIKFQEVIASGGLEYTTHTDRNGEFVIPAADKEYILSIYNEKYLFLTLHVTHSLPYMDVELQRVVEMSKNLSKVLDNDIPERTMTMDEVVVVSRLTTQKQALKEIMGNPYASPSSMVFVNPLTAAGLSSIAPLLRKIPGIEVSLLTGDVIVRGGGSVNQGNSAQVYIDGRLSYMSILDINPVDVFAIRVIKGAETSIYGMKGVNGIIMITTIFHANSKLEKKKIF